MRLDELKSGQVFLVDEQTSMLYDVVEDVPTSSGTIKNFVVLLDMFDDIATNKAFFQVLCKPGLRFLLVAMPGLNKSTAYKPKTQLTNKYLSSCLDLLVYYLHE